MIRLRSPTQLRAPPLSPIPSDRGCLERSSWVLVTGRATKQSRNTLGASLEEVCMENPYRPEPDAPPELRLSAVAFIDLLGYSKRIRGAKSIEEANDELKAIRIALDKAAAHWVKTEDGRWKLPHQVRFFTDCLVIGDPIHDPSAEAEPELGSLFFFLGLFQLQMILHGVFVRGALSVGDLYMDDQLIFGGALLDAVEAEQSLARDPRIVLCDSAMERVDKHLTWYAFPERAPHNFALLRDADDRVFIDYLTQTILVDEHEAGPFFDELQQHRDQVVSCLDQHRPEPRVWSKYLWVGHYHNWFCQRYSHYFDESHHVPITLLSSAPQLLVPIQ